MSVKKKSRKIPKSIIILIVLLIVGAIVGIVIGLLLGEKSGGGGGGGGSGLYLCNVTSGECEKSSNGIYKTLEECKSAGCKKSGGGGSGLYLCNVTSGECEKSSNGIYKTLEECKSAGCKKSGNPVCAGMVALFKNGALKYNPGVVNETSKLPENARNEFSKYSQPFAIKEDGTWNEEAAESGQHINWCSGNNMHFDIGADKPYWELFADNNKGPGNISMLNAPSNILVRWKKVNCSCDGNLSQSELCKMEWGCGGTPPGEGTINNCSSSPQNDKVNLNSSACDSEDGQWQGWATTSQFGCGDGPWGNPPYSLAIHEINDPSKNRMGAAIPWRFYCQNYGGKQSQTQAVVKNLQGQSEKACYLIQPIGINSKNPRDISDINGNIGATAGNNSEYPSYLIIPFEGCGGDCKAPAADCFNSCIGSIRGPNAAEDTINAINKCDFLSQEN